MRYPRRHSGRHAGPRARRRPARLPAQFRRQDRPRRSVRGQLARAGVRTLARTLVAAAALVGAASLAPPAELPTGPYATGSPNRAQQELMERYECSPDGFGDGSTPRSAIIRSQSGLEVVSFDRGWQIYTGARPHALVAVCLDPPR